MTSQGTGHAVLERFLMDRTGAFQLGSERASWNFLPSETFSLLPDPPASVFDHLQISLPG